jgi:hypothetical protein
MNSNFKLIVAFIFFSFASGATARADVIDDVAALLKSGNTKGVSQYFAPKLELTILADEDEYQKNEAESILRGFFTKYPPTSIKIIHKITSNPNYRFAVLNLGTGGGNFRTSISLKNISGKFLITEMRIEEESN